MSFFGIFSILRYITWKIREPFGRSAFFAAQARDLQEQTPVSKAPSLTMSSFWPKKPFSIAIVGGGLAGLSLARGLLRRGISCQVFEGAPALADDGAGLSFAVNAIEALRLVDPEFYDCFLKRCNDVSEEKDVYMTYRDGQATDKHHLLTTLSCKGSGQKTVRRILLVKVFICTSYDSSRSKFSHVSGPSRLDAGGYAEWEQKTGVY